MTGAPDRFETDGDSGTFHRKQILRISICQRVRYMTQLWNMLCLTPAGSLENNLSDSKRIKLMWSWLNITHISNLKPLLSQYVNKIGKWNELEIILYQLFNLINNSLYEKHRGVVCPCYWEGGPESRMWSKCRVLKGRWEDQGNPRPGILMLYPISAQTDWINMHVWQWNVVPLD